MQQFFCIAQKVPTLTIRHVEAMQEGKVSAAFLRSDDVRKANRQRVLRAIRSHNALSRTDISALTGLSAATVSAISSDLIAEGVLMLAPVLAAPAINSGRGRPKIALTTNPAAALVGALTFELNTVSAAVLDYSGAIVAEALATLDGSTDQAETIREVMVGCMKRALSASGAGTGSLRRVAIGVQGVTDVQGTRMLWSPVTRARDLPVRAWFAEAFGVPTRVANDCDMIALALHASEPLRNVSNFAAILLSHGVGMGLFLRGTVINGTRSSATEFGHMTHLPHGSLCRCGKHGCIEAYAGDYAIERSANGGDPDAPPPTIAHTTQLEAIGARARRADQRALAAVREAGLAIGGGLANIFALVDPFPVVLVGRGTVLFDLLEPHIREGMLQNMAGEIPADIAISCLPDEAPLIRRGCAVSALSLLDVEIANADVEERMHAV